MKKNSRLKTIIFVVVFILAISSAVGGLVTDGYKDVRNKAVRICNECIGLG